MTALRNQMSDDILVRGFATATRSSYVHAVQRDKQDDAFGQQALKAIRIERVIPNALRLNDNKQLECYSLSPTGH